MYYTEKNAGNESKKMWNIKTNRKKKNLITNSNNIKRKEPQQQRKKVKKKNKSLHKTELCAHWTSTSSCKFEGKCYFAHGIEELRKRVRMANFKTYPCVDCPLERSRCMFGLRCNYCHPGEALRRVVDSSYFDVDYYENLKKKFPNNDYPFGIVI